MRIAPTVVALVIGGISVVFAAPARTDVGLVSDTMDVHQQRESATPPAARRLARRPR